MGYQQIHPLAEKLQGASSTITIYTSHLLNSLVMSVASILAVNSNCTSESLEHLTKHRDAWAPHSEYQPVGLNDPSIFLSLFFKVLHRILMPSQSYIANHLGRYSKLSQKGGMVNASLITQDTL